MANAQQSFYWHHVVCKQFTAPFHYHPEYEIIYIDHGWGRRLVGDSIGHFGPGDLVFIAPNVPHMWQVAPECPKVNATYIQFLPDFLGAEFFHQPEMQPITKWMISVAVGMTFGRSLREEMRARFRRYPLLDKSERLLELLGILHRFSRDSGSRPLGHGLSRVNLNRRDERRMSQIFTYLNQNLTGSISQAEISQVVRLRPSAFSRLFKSATGKRFVQVVNELRIAQVCRLLVETDRTIAEIAFSCGFETLSHFNSQFRSTMKMIPQKYRRIHGAIRNHSGKEA